MRAPDPPTTAELAGYQQLRALVSLETAINVPDAQEFCFFLFCLLDLGIWSTKPIQAGLKQGLKLGNLSPTTLKQGPRLANHDIQAKPKSINPKPWYPG